MRNFVFKTLLAVALAATASTTACNKGDPNAFETHLKNLGDEEKRDDAFKQLERIVQGAATDPEDERRQKFADKVLPEFEKVWEEAGPHREQMLQMALLMERPEAVGIWAKALAVDGSAEGHEQALLALQGIRAAEAKGATEALVEQFRALNASPAKDMAEKQEGALRYEMAKTLGELRSTEAVDVLIETLEIPESKMGAAKPVYRAVVEALGQIGDPKAVDALIAVQFAVAAEADTQSLGVRAIRALGAIGEPAVPKLVATLKGENEAVNALAAKNGVPDKVVKGSAVAALGAIGSATAAPALIDYMPQGDCGEEGVTIEDQEELTRVIELRAVAAQALGKMRAEEAVDALCSCRDATHQTDDVWQIIEALGRIGNEPAYQCLKTIVETSFYGADYIASSDFKFTPRWEGTRWLILAATPDKAEEVRKVIDSNDAAVKTKVEELGWLKGLAVIEECKEDKECYVKKLRDATADWFEREVAAFNVARLSEPGDVEAAAQLARGFKTRDPSARVNIAWLTDVVAAGKPCPECVEGLSGVMKSEKLTKDRLMQAAWITARQTIAKVGGSEDSEG